MDRNGPCMMPGTRKMQPIKLQLILLSACGLLLAGCTPKADWKIGTEHEKFGFIRDGLRPLPYEGDVSVRAMLEGLRDQFGWEPIIEGGHLIGLKKVSRVKAGK